MQRLRQRPPKALIGMALPSSRRVQGVAVCALLLLPGLTRAAGSLGTVDFAAAPSGADSEASDAAAPTGAGSGGYNAHPYPSYGPPRQIPGVPSDEELEASGALIGKVLVDNQNIFNLDDPKDNTWLFRLADRLHYRDPLLGHTPAAVVQAGRALLAPPAR